MRRGTEANACAARGCRARDPNGRCYSDPYASGPDASPYGGDPNGRCYSDPYARGPDADS